MKSYLMLFGAAFFWGTTFVAQIAGMDGIGPFTYAAARFLLGTCFLLAVWLYRRSRRQEKAPHLSGWRAGLGAGLLMFIASSLQQVALLYTTGGKAAFISSLYIILVPLGAMLLWHHPLRREHLVAAILALIGLYLLSVQNMTALAFGDFLLLIDVFFWAGQILFIARFAAQVDPIELAAAEICTCFAGSVIAAGLFESISLPLLLHNWLPIFYGGLFSAGIAFLLQILGQQHAEPAPAAILMSLEAPIGAISTWLVLGEVMSRAQIAGAALMLLAVLVAQWHAIFTAPESQTKR